ncbi:DUF421 domain-containing protein [Paenibacillus aquistagni]|uniref:DUF421 domain-containing protein n=1 Tax=Paenibacillus aquistagni TaxID=1852522 RepID=UPI000B5124FD|nr:DUF421 domain-containing protein [Paenibacillus aquistagni]
MNWSLIGQTILIYIAGVALLRVSGRKSISQMTIPETVIMIAIGTLLIQPVTGRGLWTTFGVAAVLVIALLITGIIQLKSDRLESLISGKAVSVIENGTIHVQNLRKLRLSVDKLETRLRQHGIANIGDVEWATLEVNGQLGYSLKPDMQPATKKDIHELMKLIDAKLNDHTLQGTKRTSSAPLFTEVVRKEDHSPSDPLQ